MSTIALPRVGVGALAEPERKSSLLQRLIEARVDAARRRIRSHLATMDDARLGGLGFTAEDIQALRSGTFRLPSGKLDI